jgi:uracil-DNA glycosylase
MIRSARRWARTLLHRQTFQEFRMPLPKVLSGRYSICERLNVRDSFQQAVGRTLSVLRQIREGFGPYPMASSASLDKLKIVCTHAARATEEALQVRCPEPAGDVTFETVREAALVCVKCPHLAKTRTQVVFGVGNPKADLMFVGEAPGADEDARGEPFVGRAGQLLTKIIQAMGFRREDVYIANVLKCRPDMPSGTSGNRKPTAEEMSTCLPWLERQIDLIKPRVIVALGATAVEGLFGATAPVSKVRGRWLDFLGIPVMATYHPAYLLRNQSSSEKRKVWEDMLQVLERLGRPITAKQRKFFTKSES